GGSPVSALATLPDGLTLVAGRADGFIELRDAATGRRRDTFAEKMDGPIVAIRISQDGKQLLATNERGDHRLWDLSTKRLRTTLGGNGKGTAAALSPDASLVAVHAADHSLQLRDVALSDIRHAAPDVKSAVLCAAFSPDGRLLATGHRDHTVQLW